MTGSTHRFDRAGLRIDEIELAGAAGRRDHAVQLGRESEVVEADAGLAVGQDQRHRPGDRSAGDRGRGAGGQDTHHDGAHAHGITRARRTP
ncbi:MAG TPA: hypothetical protein VHW23_33500 [Kofleriaceae bacterium]|nr:hypothetical protein [Kofleriaceae bacterium]